jgi:hypothetical protein
MIIGFFIFGLGYSLVWCSLGKARPSATGSIMHMPILFTSSIMQNILLLLTILGGLSHLILAIVIFSWLRGILYWILSIIIFQIFTVIIFLRTQNPALPFFSGLIAMFLGLIWILVSWT